MKLLMKEWYVPEDAAPGEKYLIRGLTGPEAVPVINFFREKSQAAAREGIPYNPETIVVPAEILEDIVQAGLMGWAGIEDSDGNPLDFDKKYCLDLPWPVFNDLAGQILMKSQIAPDQEKNLSSPSKPKRKKKSSTA